MDLGGKKIKDQTSQYATGGKSLTNWPAPTPPSRA
jgi:hypothetical protein